ncbi:hypothetical protein PHMEG_00019531 [Phytophthora megakarya]|uniref:CCHC-type domain-containing protein n=1 Tax=Phytophthora megakarya TaxID=4795 RepID=A0A225VT82_9STRA|nr:hypothetical protein PHMEG_00019531 [Phytophthora megakarya]
MNEQIAAQAARMETLASKPRAARKAQPPKYQGSLNEDLDLWYRQFVADCDRSQVVRTWETFKAAMRKRFLPPDHEYCLREKLCKLTQLGPLHDYVSAFQDVLIQCKIPISPLELRFYFQQGLRSETAHHLREHHPATLDETIELALRFDHGAKGGNTNTATAEWMQRATCHKCKQVGHIAPNCPSTK